MKNKVASRYTMTNNQIWENLDLGGLPNLYNFIYNVNCCSMVDSSFVQVSSFVQCIGAVQISLQSFVLYFTFNMQKHNSNCFWMSIAIVFVFHIQHAGVCRLTCYLIPSSSSEYCCQNGPNFWQIQWNTSTLLAGIDVKVGANFWRGSGTKYWREWLTPTQSTQLTNVHEVMKFEQ